MTTGISLCFSVDFLSLSQPQVANSDMQTFCSLHCAKRLMKYHLMTLLQKYVRQEYTHGPFGY
jgi:hypothetical protein